MSGRVFIGSHGEYVRVIEAKANLDNVMVEEHDDYTTNALLEALGEDFVEVDPVEEGG